MLLYKNLIEWCSKHISPPQNLPPIRNKNFRKKKKGKAKESSKKTKDENTKNRIKSYDYEAWAKLDVVS